jgi:hypothetical protein
MVIFWIVLAALLATFAVYTAFFALSTAKRILAAGVELGPFERLVCYVLLLVGWPADVVYNAIVGTWMFREWPKWHRLELTFSARVGRLVNSGDSERRAKALERARMLNAADPGHIKVP